MEADTVVLLQMKLKLEKWKTAKGLVKILASLNSSKKMAY